MARHRSAHPAIQLFPFLAVLVSVMGALIFLLLITSKRIPQVALARARAAEAKANPAPSETIEEPSTTLPEPILLPPSAEPPVLPPVAELEPTGPSPAELRAQERAAAREAEQAALLDDWRQRIKALQQNRDATEAQLQRQTLITTAAERKQLQLLSELQDVERKLGSLTGRVSVGSMQAGTADKERLQLEQRILGLRRQMKAVSDQQRADAGKYSIVPYDGKSGTTRRPILVEVTATGFRFVPEDVFIGAGDIEGFNDRQNPLLAGATALTQYWNQFNQQQGTVSADSQPYVLMIVRPSGTLGYYVSVRLLSALKQPHGYELVDEDVDLKWPAVDVGAQAACRAAVEAMLANRGAMTAGNGRSGSSGGIGSLVPGGLSGPVMSGNASGSSVGNGNAASHASGRQPGDFLPGDMPARGANPPRGSGKNFAMQDLEPRFEEVGSRSWEDPSRFGGLEHRRDKTKSAAASGSSSDGDRPSPATGPGTGRGVASANPSRPQKIPASTEPPKSEVSEASAETTPSTGNEPPSETAVSNGSRPAPASPAPRVVPTPRPTPARPASRSKPAPLPPDPEQRLARGPRRGNGEDIPYEQLQRRRWGQFEEGANIGVEKSVTIRVDADQIIVANQLIIPIRPGASRNELFDHLLAAIDEHANSWGPASTGFFWIPSLKFVISPGGNQIYDRLAPLVTRSGLRADTEFTLEKPAAPQQGRRS